ncbi:unnamed protein product, partial [Musa textilis]
GEVAYKVLWYSSGLEQVPFAVVGNAVVGDVVARSLELDQKLISSSSARERLRAYDALLGSSGLVLLLVVTSTTMPFPTINGGLSFFL